MNIIEEITRRRRHRIGLMGHTMGVALPAGRSTPLAPFGRTGRGNTFIVCEVKRASPSRGSFAPRADAVEQARRFVERGIHTLSVLTEEEFFSGSLEDLLRIKKSFPDLCLMRKDFIIDEEDVEVSFRAGADALLLIASMHPVGTLRKLYRRAKGLGLEVLLEVHDEEDLEKARNIGPTVTGFNSRNLRTFNIDHLAPLKLRTQVDWKTETVYESGITSPEHAALALSAGFSGILIGEAAMRDTGLIDLITEMEQRRWHDFWYRLYDRKAKGGPLVKVCGITREEDARLAAELGADLLGFILAPSPRRADPSLLLKLADLKVQKVGVVVQGVKQGLEPSVKGLLDDGLLDALQFHGEEHPDTCFDMAFPYYKALRVKSGHDVERISNYKCPRVLIDTYVQDMPGGTGRRVAQSLVDAVRARYPLWLAGGIGPDNVGEILRSCEPELIDASSRLEVEPGRKDPKRMRDFFHILEAD